MKAQPGGEREGQSMSRIEGQPCIARQPDTDTDMADTPPVIKKFFKNFYVQLYLVSYHHKVANSFDWMSSIFWTDCRSDGGSECGLAGLSTGRVQTSFLISLHTRGKCKDRTIKPGHQYLKNME